MAGIGLAVQPVVNDSLSRQAAALKYLRQYISYFLSGNKNGYR